MHGNTLIHLTIPKLLELRFFQLFTILNIYITNVFMHKTYFSILDHVLKIISLR